jgi:cytochrome P450 family 142 subfamily A polypeptide 1
MSSAARPDSPTVDILDGAFYVDNPYPIYAWMRDNDPIYWDAVNELWCVSRYDDIVEIEKNKELFISSNNVKGGYRPNIPADDSLIGLDDPLHHKRRNLVSRRFTPRAVSAWQDDIRQKVIALIEPALQRRSCDVVADLAAPLPAMMIGKLLGFPDDAWPQLRDWSERTIALGGGPRYFNEDGLNAAIEFGQRSVALYAERKTCPADDVMSIWAKARIDGAPMTPEVVGSDCLLLLDGGAETTRTVIARMLVTLAAQPEQWKLLRNGADLTVATEEFIRYVTPIHNMCRAAARDTTMHGKKVRAGEQLVLMYSSANRDPQHFTEPEQLDVTRSPNNHLSFGFGTHFCLGAALARLEIRTFFEEFVRRVSSFSIVPGSVVEMPNAFVYGLRGAQIELVAK